MVKRGAAIAACMALSSAGCALLLAKSRPSGWDASEPPRECPSLAIGHVVDGALGLASGLLTLVATAALLGEGCRWSTSSGMDQPDCQIVLPAMASGPLVIGGVAFATMVSRRRDQRCHQDARAHHQWLAARAREQRARPSSAVDAGPSDAGPSDAGLSDAGTALVGDAGSTPPPPADRLLAPDIGPD